ncbi:MAG: hypothetical protein MAG431_02186 [Chloroflexi bacterium]|nr:hypothetical protein [Chloroflexota bacterium]
MTQNKNRSCPPFEKHIPEEARQHAKAAHQEMRESWEALFPPEFVEHRKAARKEMLMAARSMIDAAIDRVDES